MKRIFRKIAEFVYGPDYMRGYLWPHPWWEWRDMSECEDLYENEPLPNIVVDWFCWVLHCIDMMFYYKRVKDGEDI